MNRPKRRAKYRQIRPNPEVESMGTLAILAGGVVVVFIGIFVYEITRGMSSAFNDG